MGLIRTVRSMRDLTKWGSVLLEQQEALWQLHFCTPEASVNYPQHWAVLWRSPPAGVHREMVFLSAERQDWGLLSSSPSGTLGSLIWFLVALPMEGGLKLGGP